MKNEKRLQFLDPLTNDPLEVPHQDVTDAVAQFHQSGANPYAADEPAIAGGRKLYQRWCQACHLPDGTGRIGPRVSRTLRTGIALLAALQATFLSGWMQPALAAPSGAPDERPGGCPSERCDLECRCRFDSWSAETFLKFGYGMTSDPEAAAYWYRRAAEGGDPRAAYNWGLMLQRGQGTDADPEAALTWLRRAADRGSLDALYVLGNMHRTGLGVRRSAAAAAELYREAAERGHAGAQHALGNVLGNGLGGAADLVGAYKWWRIAAGKGHPLAADALRQAESLMTLAEMRRAERLVERWRADQSEP